ncbi:MAG: TRAP transporter substrate-binding protein DctP [Salipiger thiooxidans]|uniref:TRAP transporter substrate-binding protein DctP n=1 Tax=Salipiger thiooxidans TaxID=282683 RepID=UPI001CFC0C7E|nr:TRAP transporter substrate-binding protein DctP [Salipiger thiooxidans]
MLGIGRTFCRLAAVAALAAIAIAGTSPGVARAEETINWKAVTLHRNGNSYNKWLWFQEEAARRTDGRLQVEIVTFPEFGLTGTDVLRVMESGLISIAEVSTGYVSGDFPLIEATDLPGMVSGLDQSRKIYDIWQEQIVAPREDVMGGKVFATFVWGSIYLMSKDPVTSAADIAGKKIRVFAPAQARFIEEMHGEPVSMPISEVYSALQRGVIDGMITGLNQIKPMSAWEITPNITDIGIAPLGAYIVISRKAWDDLPEDIQQVLLDMQDEFTTVGWETGAAEDSDGMATAAEHGMTVNAPVNEAFREELFTISQDVIFPWWQERAGAEGKAKFEEILAPMVGMSD